MLTKKEIEKKAIQDAHDFPDTSVGNAHEIAFFRGAKWANEQNAELIENLQEQNKQRALISGFDALIIQGLEERALWLKMRVEQLEKAYKQACNLI